MNEVNHRVKLTSDTHAIFPFVSQQIQIDGHAIAYLDEGPSDHEQTILCVHGNPTWCFYYREIVKRFSQSHRVVAVDHLGCGRSDKPPQKAAEYTLRAHRDRLLKLIKELDLQRITLLAHDWGGAIGLATLLQARERFERIALLNTGAFPPPYLPARIAACRIPFFGTAAVRGLNGFAKAAITMAMSRSEMRPEVADGLLAPYDSWANRVAIDAFVKDIPMKNSHPTFGLLEEVEAALPSLDALPNLLVWGMKDWCFRPECLERFRQAWPSATTVEVPDAGHYVMEDAAEEVLEAMNAFLKS